MNGEVWAIIAGVGVALGVLGFRQFAADLSTMRRQTRLVRRLGGTLQTRAIEDELELPFSQRILDPVRERLVRSLGSRLVPAKAQEELARRLRMAGVDRSPLEFGLLRIVTAVVLMAAGFMLAALGILPAGDAILVPVALGALGYLIFGVRLNTAYRKRQEAIERNLPEAFDLLSVCVEAGLSFEAALRRSAVHLPDATGQEFQRAVADLQVGMTRLEALRALAERTRLEDLMRFAVLMGQADRTGASISGVLHAQAERVKERRVFRAREQAAAVPVKILFPMVMFIFPALFIAILGPGMLSIIHAGL